MKRIIIGCMAFCLSVGLFAGGAVVITSETGTKTFAIGDPIEYNAEYDATGFTDASYEVLSWDINGESGPAAESVSFNADSSTAGTFSITATCYLEGTHEWTDGSGTPQSQTYKFDVSESFDIDVVEVTEIEPADDKEFVALDETLTKEDFDITTNPTDKEGESFLTVAPLTFSATGSQTITATCGTSSETCTLTAVDVEISLIP